MGRPEIDWISVNKVRVGGIDTCTRCKLPYLRYNYDKNDRLCKACKSGSKMWVEFVDANKTKAKKGKKSK